MASRTLQAHVLGLVALAMLALSVGESQADPKAKDRWESADGKMTFSATTNDPTGAWSNTVRGPKGEGTNNRYHYKGTNGQDAVYLEGRDAFFTIRVELDAKECIIYRTVIKGRELTSRRGKTEETKVGPIKGTWK